MIPRISGPVAALALLVAMPVTLAQSRIGEGPLPAFEAVSILPSHPINGPRISVSPDTGAFIAEGISVYRLIGFAYDIELSRITGGPDWLRSKYYEIEAYPSKNADEPSVSAVAPDELRQLVRGLLYDHFGLRAHREQLPLYILEMASGGTLMRRARRPAGQRDDIRYDTEDGRLVAESVTAADIAASLGELLGRPVLDHTGLRGTYDIDMTWEHTAASAPNPQVLTTALSEQLGLALRWIPIEQLVVDEARELPEELGSGRVFEPVRE